MDSLILEQITAEGRGRRRGGDGFSAPARQRQLGRPERELSPGANRGARALGWFSVGLGIAQLTSPRLMSAFVLGAAGARRERTMRLLGARELLCGVGLLTTRRPAGWLWMRVLGDTMDLAMLGNSLRARRVDEARVMRSMFGVAGALALDAVASIKATRQHRATTVRRSTTAITVNRPPEEVYRFWRNLQNLPRFMAHLDAVQIRDERRSRWIARGPGRVRVEWEAEITEDRPNERLCWRSVEGSDLENAGAVSFRAAPGGRGTEVVLELEYVPPGGLFAGKLAKLLGEEPSQKAASDLRRFKQVVETGEVLHSDASIHRGMHAARPPSARELDPKGGRR